MTVEDNLVLGAFHRYRKRDKTIAADFEAGFDFAKLFRLGGGMPTRVTVPEARYEEVMSKLAGLAAAK